MPDDAAVCHEFGCRSVAHVCCLSTLDNLEAGVEASWYACTSGSTLCCSFLKRHRGHAPKFDIIRKPPVMHILNRDFMCLLLLWHVGLLPIYDYRYSDKLVST